MEYSHFIKLVKERGNLNNENEALRAVEATMVTLAERLAGGEPGNLAAQLPAGIKELVPGTGGGQDFGPEEFYNRVAGLEQVNPEQASHHARAVMATVAEAISGGESVDLMSQLPVEYGQIFYVGGDNLAQPENWRGPGAGGPAV